MGKGTIENYEGYVIRLAEYRENDVMVTFLTPNEMLSFCARGARKPTAKTHLITTPLAKLRISLQESPSGTNLKECEWLAYPDAKDEFLRAAALSFLAELTAKMLPGEEPSALYPWLDTVMGALGDPSHSVWTLALIYLAQSLRLSGYGLDVDGCVVCGKKTDIVGISYDEGGYLCRDDLRSDADKRDARTLKILRYIFRLSTADVTRVAFSSEECRLLLFELTAYLENMTGITLRSLSLLEKA